MDRKPAIEVEVRPYEAADHEGLRWLFARTPPWGRAYPRPEPLPADLEEITKFYPAGSFVAVEDDQDGEALVGFVAVAIVGAAEAEQLPDFLNTAGTISRIHHLSVAPERWRLGLGRRLTLTAIEWSRTNGCRAAILETTDRQEGAIELYQSLGFVERGRTIVGAYTLVWLELVLQGSSSAPTATR